MSEPLPMAAGSELACSLDLEELGRRARDVEELGAALVSRSRTRAGHELRFRGGTGTRASLERLIAAERECCPFLDMSLTERDGELELSLSTAPAGEPVAEAFAMTFGEPRAS